MGKRTTFSEYWFKVAQLRPCLLPATEIRRQDYRGKTWYMVFDPGGDRNFRLNSGGYSFVGLLDGRRTVAEAWKICTGECGDDAPTQPEAIQILGQLFTNGMLYAEMPADSRSIFQRFEKRRKQELQATMKGFLFPKLPLWNPDHFLSAWTPVVSKIFSRWGLLLWLLVVLTGLAALFSRLDGAGADFNGVLSSENLPYLYLALLMSKTFHELSHAFACKSMGLIEGGGEVKKTGIMLLLFTPVPYVDASSSWRFKNRWHRITVAASGVMAEIFLAAVAAMVWANSPQDSILSVIAFDIMVTGGVSTVLCNGNPLLRYDAYFVLADLLEIPNLGQKAQQYLIYLVKRYPWGMEETRNPANNRFERWLYGIYGIASTIYRVFFILGMVLMLADIAFFVGMAMAAISLFVWIFLPLAKLVKYLFSSTEVGRVRNRAIGVTFGTIFIVTFFVALFPYPDYSRVEGVVDAGEKQTVYAKTPGFLREYMPSGEKVENEKKCLVRLENSELIYERESLLAQKDELQAMLEAGELSEPAVAASCRHRLLAVEKRLRALSDRIAALEIVPDITGIWVAADLPAKNGSYFKQGERLGQVIVPGSLIVRAVSNQDELRLLKYCENDLEIRVKDRPDLFGNGTVLEKWPVGRKDLPSAALTVAGGGLLPNSSEDKTGAKSSERFFEIRVSACEDLQEHLRMGQVVVVRFRNGSRPLLVQGIRLILQIFQRRYHV